MNIRSNNKMESIQQHSNSKSSQMINQGSFIIEGRSNTKKNIPIGFHVDQNGRKWPKKFKNVLDLSDSDSEEEELLIKRPAPNGGYSYQNLPQKKTKKEVKLEDVLSFFNFEFSKPKEELERYFLEVEYSKPTQEEIELYEAQKETEVPWVCQIFEVKDEKAEKMSKESESEELLTEVM